MSSIQDQRDRIIWALTNDLAFLTTRDRVFLADFLDTNSVMDMPKNSWLTIMVEYNYHKQEAAEWVISEQAKCQA
jgi:hypothetical protein